MKTIKEKFTQLVEFFKSLKTGNKFTFLLFLIAFVVYFVSLFLIINIAFVDPYPGILFKMSKAIIAASLLKLIDELMLYEIPTMKVLKENSTAYAIYIVAYSIVIAAAFIS